MRFLVNIFEKLNFLVFLNKIRFRKQSKTLSRGQKPLGTPFQDVLRDRLGYDADTVFTLASRVFTLKPKRAKMHFARFRSKLRFRECSKTIRHGRKPLNTSFQVILSPFDPLRGDFFVPLSLRQKSHTEAGVLFSGNSLKMLKTA